MNEHNYKLTIAYKEARETKYWLRILKDTAYIIQEAFQILCQEIEEILRILSKIIDSSKNNLYNEKQ
jgi:four helix bundle protein